MDFSTQSDALVVDDLELLADLAQPEAPQGDQCKCSRDEAGAEKPTGLVERRSYGEIPRRLGIVPRTRPGRLRAKAIPPGSQVRIRGLTPPRAVHPVGVDAVETIPK